MFALCSQNGDMRGREPRLSEYPYVILRVACRQCQRSGQYRIVRLAAKHGPEIELRDLMNTWSADCFMRTGRSVLAHERCKIYLPDLEPSPRPPDLPPTMRGARVIKGGRLWRIVKGGSDEDAA